VGLSLHKRPTHLMRRSTCNAPPPWAIKGGGFVEERGLRGGFEDEVLQDRDLNFASFLKFPQTREAAFVPQDARVLPANLHSAVCGFRLYILYIRNVKDRFRGKGFAGIPVASDILASLRVIVSSGFPCVPTFSRTHGISWVSGLHDWTIVGFWFCSIVRSWVLVTHDLMIVDFGFTRS
jgi:hypothetical protein